MSGATVRYRANPRFVPDGVSIRFGGGDDASLGSDGTDLELLLAATADLVVGRTGAPSPDSLLHLWAASAGAVAAPADSILTLEDDGDATLGVLAPAASFGGLRVGFPAPGSNADAYLVYYGPSATPSDAWAVGIDGATRLQYSAGAFAFQEATIVSTLAGDLTLGPDGDVVIPSGDALSVEDATDSTSPTTGSIRTGGGLGVAKAIFGKTVNTAVGTTTAPNMTHRGGVGSVTTDIHAGRTNIADDGTATVIADSVDIGLLVVMVSQATSVGVALLQVRPATTPKVNIVSQSGDFTFEVTTGDVTGTTGTDGNFVVSVRDGAVEFENRLGGGCGAGWYLIGGSG